MLGLLDLGLTIAGALQGKLHVGLSTAEPDIAYKNILELDGLRANNPEGMRSAARRRLKRDFPTTIRIRSADAVCTCQLQSYPLPGRSPSPNRIQLATLEYHV